MKPFRRPRNWSLQTKLISLGAATSALAVMLACSGFVLHDVQKMRGDLVAKLQSQGRMVAFNATGALTFQDEAACRQLLGTLRMLPEVQAARIYDASGVAVASYGDEELAPASAGAAQALAHVDSWTSAAIVAPVEDGSEVVGSLFLRAHLGQLRAQLFSYAWTVGSVTLMALATAVFCGMRLSRRLSDPVRKLAETARRVGIDHDYSLRAEIPGQDELGDLALAFNDMLAEIQAAKQELQDAQGELEQRVVARTAQLSAEITQREAAQREMQSAKDTAEAASRSKSEFLANMSHEIRTPLNGILGFANLLVRGAEENEAERREFLETIKSSGEHLLALINDILDLSKIEAGQLTVERITCPIQPLITEVISVLRVKAIEKGLALECHWQTRIPETIVTDPARLRQLLINLVGNAVKFTEFGSVELRVRLDDQRTDPKLLIDIADTGIGIAPEKLCTIFDPFVQADSSVTRRFGGTGLGLAICRKLAAALGGEIGVSSELGHGSVFTLAVDTGSLEGVDYIEPNSSDGVSRAEPTRGPAAVNLHGVRVLLVEDGETNRRLISLVLGRAGATVDEAENGLIGVDRAMHAPYDVILMDMQMPVLDGYSAAGVLRQEGIATPIVALTAHAMVGDREKCVEAGCTDYLTKPVCADQLLEMVGSLAGLESRKPSPPDGPAAGTAHGDPATPGSGGSRVTGARPSSSTGPASDQPRVSRTPISQTLSRMPISFACDLPLDDPDFREIVAEFIDRLDEKLSAMDMALGQGDQAAMAQLAHWVKGAGGTAGFPFLTDPARRLEDAAKGGEESMEAILRELRALALGIRQVNEPRLKVGV